jgi:tRNA modification GTPase
MCGDETIAAIATAKGEASIAVVRMSGEETFKIIDQVFQTRLKKTLAQADNYTVHYGHLIDPKDEAKQAVLDEVLVTVFRSPHSYTTEDMVEISCHGGPFVQGRVMKLLLDQGVRLAEPGEFTKRAFLHGRIDLAQAEAVQDMIRVRGEAALKNAAEQLNGALSRTIQDLRAELLDILAHLEAAIDFPDEDIELMDREGFNKRLQLVSQRIAHLIQGASLGHVLREGVRTVIAGRPNVGKSSLLNRLVGVDRAIVTDIPGTTRDSIEEEVELAGVRFRIVDTAGLTSTQDRVEAMGIERAKELISQADLTLFVVDGSFELQDTDHQLAQLLVSKKIIRVINKSDLKQVVGEEELSSLGGPCAEVRISALDGTGMADLEKTLVRETLTDQTEAPESSWVTNLRHRKALEVAQKDLSQTCHSLRDKQPPEIVAVDVKGALHALGQIVGEVTTEDLLDQIFSQFCIGK